MEDVIHVEPGAGNRFGKGMDFYLEGRHQSAKPSRNGLVIRHTVNWQMALPRVGRQPSHAMSTDDKRIALCWRMVSQFDEHVGEVFAESIIGMGNHLERVTHDLAVVIFEFHKNGRFGICGKTYHHPIALEYSFGDRFLEILDVGFEKINHIGRPWHEQHHGVACQGRLMFWVVMACSQQHQPHQYHHGKKDSPQILGQSINSIFPHCFQSCLHVYITIMLSVVNQNFVAFHFLERQLPASLSRYFGIEV